MCVAFVLRLRCVCVVFVLARCCLSIGLESVMVMLCCFCVVDALLVWCFL